MADDNFARLLRAQYQTPAFLAARRKFHQLEQPYIRLEDEVYRRLDTAKPLTILDLGCGYGDLLIDLVKRGVQGNFFGVDVSPGMITSAQAAAAKENVPIHFQVGSGADLPFPDNHFDLVITKYSLHCMEDIPQALIEIKRVLKPSGTFFILTRSNRSQINFDAFREQLATDFGLTIVPNLWSRFTMEMVPTVITNFSIQETQLFETAIHIQQPELFLEYLDTYRPYFDPVPDDALWLQIRAAASAYIEKEITTHGEYIQPVVHGIAVCQKT